MKARRFHRGFLFIGVSLIVMGLLVSLSSAIFDYTIGFAVYGGAIIESNEELSIQNTGISKAGSTITPQGQSASNPVLMASTSPLPLASTSVPKGQWYYHAEIYSIAGTTPANKVFRVELYRWDSTNLEYDLDGTLYIKSTASPQSSEGARVFFAVGSSPGSSEAFMIQVFRVG